LFARFGTQAESLVNPEFDIRTPYAQKPGISKIRNVTVVPGHGIGPELCEQVMRVFNAAHCPI